MNQRQCLATLPRKFTVSDILGEYLASKKQRNVTDNIFVEIVEGVFACVPALNPRPPPHI